METHQILTILLTVLFLMLGGAYIIYIYDAFRRTKQRFLLPLSVGFFLLITGGALPVLVYTLAAANQVFMILAVILQIGGITAIFYSTVR
jgi:hypothetical protein